MHKIGFIGSGKMAGAIIKGLVKSGFAKPENLLATQRESGGADIKSKKLGIKIILDNKELADWADVIFIATKPNQAEGVLNEIKDYVSPQKLFISVAAGITINKIQTVLSDDAKIIRVMPNTPALVGEGMSAMIGSSSVSNEELDYVKKMLSTIGKCIILDDEAQMDIVTAISGSGPAFYYKVINEIARAGEKLGMDYEQSLLLSIQTALGSAKMALNRDISMEQLISNVATKGGCTAVGVDCMDSYNTQKVFADVINKTTQKAHELGNC